MRRGLGESWGEDRISRERGVRERRRLAYIEGGEERAGEGCRQATWRKLLGS